MGVQMATRPQTRRDQHGAGHSYVLDGERVPGVTSILSDGFPKPALVDWAARATAGYAFDNWERLAGMGPAERLRSMEKGRFDRTDEAKTIGSRVHAYAAEILAGERVLIPDAYVGPVEQCLAFLDDYDVAELAYEAMVINRRWRYCGTLDLLATVNALDGSPTAVIDWKTGLSGVYPEHALQVAAYAHAETFLIGEGDEIAMPAVQVGLAVQLRADSYDVWPLDISEAAYRTFLYVAQVATFRNLPRGQVIGEPLPQRKASA